MTTVLILLGVGLVLLVVYVATHQWRGPEPLPSVMKTDADFPENPNDTPAMPLSAGTPTSADVEEVVPTVPYTYHVFMQDGGVGLTPYEIVEVFDLVAMAQAKNVTETTSSYQRALPLSSYIYQLVPSRTTAGELVVEVRALPPRYLEDGRWKVQVMEVSDGGAQYFDATVNLDTKEVSQFYVHGEA